MKTKREMLEIECELSKERLYHERDNSKNEHIIEEKDKKIQHLENEIESLKTDISEQKNNYESRIDSIFIIIIVVLIFLERNDIIGYLQSRIKELEKLLILQSVVFQKGNKISTKVMEENLSQSQNNSNDDLLEEVNFEKSIKKKKIENAFDYSSVPLKDRFKPTIKPLPTSIPNLFHKIKS